MRARASLLVALAVSLLLVPVPAVNAHHPGGPPGEELTTTSGAPGTTWRSVAFAPDGSHALVVGQHKAEEASRDLVARWTPSDGLVEVYNRSGAGLVDVTFHEDGTSLVVGLQNKLLLGQPGNYRNVWNDTEFHDQGLTFFGLRGDFRPGQGAALVGGSSLLRVDLDGEITVLHGGRDTFFRAMDWNPTAPFAWVEAALERQDRALLGTIWRISQEVWEGSGTLNESDNVQLYGRLNPGRSLVNTVAFAPNGSFAAIAGRDGVSSSLLTWSSVRQGCHLHDEGANCHDHRWQYLPTEKSQGPITCIAWHPSKPYALATGLDRDVLGYLGPRIYAPTMHTGPDLFGCAFHPAGTHALAVGAHGTLVHVRPGQGPLGAVVSPEAGALTPPQENATFLVGGLERASGPPTDVTATVAGTVIEAQAEREGPWWVLTVDARDLRDGTHELRVRLGAGGQAFTFTHPFLVNNEEFTPPTPSMREPSGLEGTGSDADGSFTLHWEQVDAPVIYEVHEQRTGEGANASRTLRAGPGNNLTVHVGEDGSYLYKVRARNAFNASPWSDSVVVNVVLDSDGDGVPDSRDPRPYVYDTWGDSDGDGFADDVEYRQCSDPEDANSTPNTDDDGDGIPNAVECLQGTDPLDPLDPPPANTGDGGEDGSDGGGEENGSPSVGVLALLATALVAALARSRQPE